MPTLKLRFPGGRYHATPWGHHVNEGLIEWPPCPWRLLRALISCGFSTQQWTEIPLLARQLIGKLAGVLPSYQLPAASAAHSRHFMPVGSLAKGREQTTLVFDTWANVGEDSVLIHWPCELSGEEAALLSQLATSLGYLGRSESWVEAEVIAENQIEPTCFNAFPHREGTHPGRDYEQIALMAAIPPEEYQTWHKSQMEQVLEPYPLPEGKKKPGTKLLKDREKVAIPFPTDTLSCLVKDTAWWKMHGWSQPPGSRRVLYWRQSDSLQVDVPQRTQLREVPPITAVLLSITTPSGNRSALPHCTRTLPQAELFHRAIIGRLGKGLRVDCPELIGKDEQGKPLHDHHEHAHILPLDLDGDKHLDHLLVFAKMGLGNDAQRAIRTLRRTWTKGGVGDLQLAVAGSGKLEIFRGLLPPFCHAVERLLGPQQIGSRTWKSITPVVLPRFLKERGKDTLLGQINAELASRCLPAAVMVDIDPELTRSLRHHVRRRYHGGMPPKVDMGYGLRISFAEPIHGPLCLGYASHFGLGLFTSEQDS